MRRDVWSFCSRALDVLASVLSLLLFFWNVGANVWAVVSFYQEQRYYSMGLFIFLIFSSSMLLQTYSWLWFRERSDKMDGWFIDLVHVLQLGVFFRCCRMLKLTVKNFEQESSSSSADNPSYDLSTLGLFKAFSGSAPQIVLMMTNIIQVQDVQPFTVIKIISSLSSLSFTVLSYHRRMCTFLTDDQTMGWSSSVLYFLWNLFLIAPRVLCVSLFASAMPCYFAAHFLSLWMLLILWAWWQKTQFMDSNAGEWLYRSTVALIWYFSWFRVTSKQNDKASRQSSNHKAIIYHVVMGSDTMLLLGLWWWWRSVESARLDPLPINPYLLIAMLVTFYVLGILLRSLYYWKFHPKQAKLEKKHEMEPEEHGYDTPDARVKPEIEAVVTVLCHSPKTLSGIQKRMRDMAENFYC